MKKFLLFLIICLCFGCTNNNTNIQDNSKIEENKINQENYGFKENTKVLVSNMYNYENSEMDSGYLEIIDGNLVLEELDGKIVKTYDIVNSKYITGVNKCEDIFYVVVTTDGIVYRTDTNMLFVESPFFEIEGINNIKNAKINDSDCDNIAIELLTNENEIKIIN